MTSGESLRLGLTKLGLSLSPGQLDQLGRYLAELRKWNRRINLVAEAPDEQVIDSHFLDSLTLLPLLDPCPEPGLVDVGSGAGFPGLVVKIARPDLAVTLVEPRQKRTAFLRQVIRILGLRNIRVAESRLEKGSEEFASWRRTVPLFTSRALTAIAPFLELCEGYSAPGGRVICMKGRQAPAEIAAWQSHKPAAPYRLTKTLTTALPFSGTPRTLLVFTRSVD